MTAHDTARVRYRPRTVAEAMTLAPYTVGRDQPITVAQAMLHDHHIRHLPVLEAGKLVGVVSEHDLAVVEGMQDLVPGTPIVDDAMSPDVYAVTPDASLAEVAAHMSERALGSAVVEEDGRVVGVFTTVDALRALALCLADTD
jgi:acetoin utilization protein AcuB